MLAESRKSRGSILWLATLLSLLATATVGRSLVFGHLRTDEAVIYLPPVMRSACAKRWQSTSTARPPASDSNACARVLCAGGSDGAGEAGGSGDEVYIV